VSTVSTTVADRPALAGVAWVLAGIDAVALSPVESGPTVGLGRASDAAVQDGMLARIALQRIIAMRERGDVIGATKVRVSCRLDRGGSSACSGLVGCARTSLRRNRATATMPLSASFTASSRQAKSLSETR
jgi:hypothetical protein